MRHSPFDRTEARIRLLRGSNCYFSARKLRAKEEGQQCEMKKEGETEGEREEAGSEQMEIGESRNKRYVNPRNGAVYSSHKKANKIFFRSGRYTPEPSSVLIPRFRSPPLDSFLLPEK